ncbi:PEP-CTERM sorting domain-containing protein [Methylococcus sp. EFPC2]|uniref:PEP-CTERM sorting domain-containing protein n=1 Tax=Methylococcus sp. EFPC2 TaxID=2812648 RepID=UPI0019672CA8|nr:PEP-CTERM sorting domain-containing protein [Methylococcus sp. EFPC2]QSA95695.1 PEP-CTERM sorting domain-containing protein [Methylococcus sp. EFPC2]
MNKKPLLLGTAFAMAMAVSVNASADRVIDLFSVTQAKFFDVTTNGVAESRTVNDPNPYPSPLNSIIGDNRDISVNLINSPDPANVNASASVTAGVYNFSQDTQAGAEAQIQWDGSNVGVEGADGGILNPTGLGGINLWDTGSLFSFDVIFADQGFTADVIVYTDATHFSRIRIDTVVPVSNQTFSLAFAAFENAAFVAANGGAGSAGLADLNNVGALQVILNPLGTGLSIDLTIDNITTVPEPATLSLLGMGLLGMGASARRRKLANA